MGGIIIKRPLASCKSSNMTILVPAERSNKVAVLACFRLRLGDAAAGAAHNLSVWLIEQQLIAVKQVEPSI